MKRRSLFGWLAGALCAPVAAIAAPGSGVKHRACKICKHPAGDSVFWNPFNKVTQCHACGAQPGVQVGEAAALYAFMGWLTSRPQASGPFASHIEACEAAELVDEFCRSQGWEIEDEDWCKRLREYPR